jgi:hypothetical protein
MRGATPVLPPQVFLTSTGTTLRVPRISFDVRFLQSSFLFSRSKFYRYVSVLLYILLPLLILFSWTINTKREEEEVTKLCHIEVPPISCYFL